MKITFVFCKNIKWWAIFTPVIQYFQKTDFSHCAIVVSKENCEDMVYEAEYPLTRKIKFTDWMNTYAIKHAYLFTVDDKETQDKMLKWLSESLNEPYSILELLAILLNIITGGLIAKKAKSDIYGVICTELLGEFLKEFYGVEFNKPQSLIDLNDVLNQVMILSKNKEG